MTEADLKKPKRLKDPLFWLTTFACTNCLVTIIYFLSVRKIYSVSLNNDGNYSDLWSRWEHDLYEIPRILSIISIVSAIHYIICLAKWRSWAAAIWRPSGCNTFMEVNIFLLLAWIGLAGAAPESLIFTIVPVICNLLMVLIVGLRGCGMCVCGRPIKKGRKRSKDRNIGSGIEDMEAGMEGRAERAERVEQFGFPYDATAQIRSEAAWMGSSLENNRNTNRGSDVRQLQLESSALTRTAPGTPNRLAFNTSGLVDGSMLGQQDCGLDPPQNSIEASYKRLSARLSSTSLSLRYASQLSLPLPPTPANSMAYEHSFASHSNNSSRSISQRLPQEAFYPDRPLSQVHPALRAESEVPASPNSSSGRGSPRRPTTADSSTLPSRFPSSSGRRTIASLSGLCQISPSSVNDDDLYALPPAHHRVNASAGTANSLSGPLSRRSNPPTQPLPEIPPEKPRSKVKNFFKLPPSPLRGKLEPLNVPEPPKPTYERRGDMRGWYEPEIYMQTTRFG